jgi:FixJ family two-component response regulator
MRKATHTKKIYLVDDDVELLDRIAKLFKAINCHIRCFTEADKCIQALRAQECHLLITDVRMPGIDGIELLIEAKRIMPWLPVLIMTGYSDTSMVVKAIKLGATDFIEKPLDRQELISTVKSILKGIDSTDAIVGKALTKTETIILRLILDGKSNTEAAYLLKRSVRTIEWHRNRIMRKLAVDNVVDLVKRSAGLGLVEIETKKRRSKADSLVQL